MSELLVVGVGLVLALGGSDIARSLAGRSDVSLPHWVASDEGGTLGSDLRKWAVAGLVVAYVLLVEGESLSSIGLAPMAPLALLGWIAGGFVLTVALTMVALNLFLWLDLDIPSGFSEQQRQRSVAARLFTAATAGVTESILFQGYPIERLASVTGSVLLAGALAWVAFTAVHYLGDTFSLEETLYIGVPAFSVTLLYVLSGNLLVVIVVHFAVDALSLLTSDPDGDASGTQTA